MINNSRFVSHKVILSRLNRVYRNNQFNEGDVMEWCAEAEREHLANVDTMILYLEMPFEVIPPAANGLQPSILLPCNIYRILDVFSDANNKKSFVENYNEGSYLYLPVNYDKQYIFLNFVGLPIDENGDVLIVKGHEQACETFCKIKNFEEAAMTGKFDIRLWLEFEQKFSGQIANSKYSVMRTMQRSDYNKLLIIRGNMVPKIGRISLYHLNFI